MWCKDWEHDIVKLGLANRNAIMGKSHIPKEQLGRIGNFDETCLSLDGSNTNHGGHPDCIIYDP
jgi:hypothetical protein